MFFQQSSQQSQECEASESRDYISIIEYVMTSRAEQSIRSYLAGVAPLHSLCFCTLFARLDKLFNTSLSTFHTGHLLKFTVDMQTHY